MTFSHNAIISSSSNNFMTLWYYIFSAEIPEDILLVGGIEIKVVKEFLKCCFPLWSRPDGEVFPKGVNIRIEYKETCYVEDLYNMVIKHQTQHFHPKTVIFMSGIDEIYIGFSPIDVHKRLLDTVFRLEASGGAPYLCQFIPVIIPKPKSWGNDVHPVLKSALDDDLEVYNLLLQRDFAHVVYTAPVQKQSYAYDIQAPKDWRSMISPAYGAARLLGCIIRDVCGARMWLKAGSKQVPNHTYNSHKMAKYSTLPQHAVLSDGSKERVNIFHWKSVINHRVVQYAMENHTVPNANNVMHYTDPKHHPMAQDLASDPYDPNPFLNIPAYSCDWPLVDETIAKNVGRSVARTPVCLSVVCEGAEQKRYEKMLKFKERARERLANGLPLDHNSSKFNLKPDTFHY